MKFGTHGYKSPIERDEDRDRIAQAIRMASPRPKRIKAWSALSEPKKNAWRFAADEAVRASGDIGGHG